MYLLAGCRPMMISNKVPLTRGEARLHDVAKMRASPACCRASRLTLGWCWCCAHHGTRCIPAMKRCFFCRQISTFRYLLSSGPLGSGGLKSQTA